MVSNPKKDFEISAILVVETMAEGFSDLDLLLGVNSAPSNLLPSRYLPFPPADLQIQYSVSINICLYNNLICIRRRFDFFRDYCFMDMISLVANVVLIDFSFWEAVPKASPDIT